MRYKSANDAQSLRRRCETRECSSDLRDLYFCGLHITATSGIAVHHTAPQKCALAGMSLSCRQWTPRNDTYRDPRRLRLCSTGRFQAQGNHSEKALPLAWSSRTVYASLRSFPDDSSMGHEELSLGWLPTKPRLLLVNLELFYRNLTALPCGVIWTLETAVDAHYFFITRKRLIISLSWQSSFISAFLMISRPVINGELFVDFLLITVEGICQSLYI